jgi:Chaperone of endosialidase
MKKILPFFFLALFGSTTYAQICNSGTIISCTGRIIGQEETGTVGGFGPNDEWMTIGKAPFPVPGTGDLPHGERYQRVGSTMLQQMEFRNNSPVDVVDGVIAIGAVKTASFAPSTLPRLDFEYVYQNQTTIPPSVRKTNIMTITGNNSKQITPMVGLFCPASPIIGPCYGRVGIENVAPTYTLDVNGLIRSTAALVVSDARYKKDVATIASPLDVVSKLRGTTYEFRTDSENSTFDFSEGLQSGFIAQEIEQVLPHTVFTDDQGYKSVNYVAVVPYLVEAIKELRTLNEDVVAKNADLQAQIDALRAGDASGKGATGSLDGASLPAELFQNVPNPFNNVTEIRFSLPETVRAASLLVFDMNGKQLRSFDVAERGLGSVRISANELSTGMYLYTLLADGKEIGTRRMIITE